MNYNDMTEIANSQDNKGGLRKIGDFEPPCLSPEHNPPTHMHYEPGIYEYVCPSCGKRVEFTVPYITA